ncbi:hypothetical protein PaG_05568 [Moesziomyces aphidis]|uniref:Uncharacterized protein n=1 Tax=Moesziomyces aphidis TaxID=84754 RepID=W3VI20_MOEAP|nr:hypothetical protein PaG_05568 [Moesziomyces aphidis]
MRFATPNRSAAKIVGLPFADVRRSDLGLALTLLPHLHQLDRRKAGSLDCRPPALSSPAGLVPSAPLRTGYSLANLRAVADPSFTQTLSAHRSERGHFPPLRPAFPTVELRAPRTRPALKQPTQIQASR